MTYTASFLEPEDYGRVESVCVGSPHGSAFSAPSWARYAGCEHVIVGVHKGRELVGGGVVPLSDRHVSRHVPGTPWLGVFGRSGDETENLEIAERVAGLLLFRYGEVTLTLPPEWTDIRAFTWLGMRAHVRYTYRGRGVSRYEKRVKVRPTFIHRSVDYTTPWWSVETYRTGDSECQVIFDNRYAYYWKANKGGSFHSECVNAMVCEADKRGLGFDMVGANSPQRGLFKRGFGGVLTPYYAVTTAAVKDLREPDVATANLREVSARADLARALGV